MPIAPANGIELYYEEHGDPAADPLLLVMGLGAQLIGWPDGFVDRLVERGYRVIRYDNRDVGLSTKLGDDFPDVAAALSGRARPAYVLSDLAADAAGLLDHLGIERAHVVGASMGGMIVQALAIEHPARVRSLCSIMSTTGAPGVGQPTPEATAALTAPPAASREEAMERAVESGRLIGSRTYPTDAEELRRRAGAAYDRAFFPQGTARQLVGIVASGDRTAGLARVKVPTLVVHGLEDTLVTPSGGRATAEAVPGAELLELAGMGHDLPEPLWDTIADAIDKNARKA